MSEHGFSDGPRAFAILPCAGHSRRMGAPKLLLPWHGRTLIEVVIGHWRETSVERIVAVVRADDQPLAEACLRGGAELVRPPLDPPDMRTSVGHALRYLAASTRPTDDDYWLVAPADMPRWHPDTVARLLEVCRAERPWIAVPIQGAEVRDQGSAGELGVSGHRRGHPTAFSWRLVPEALALGDDEGLRVLLDRHPVREVVTADSGVLFDIDTPQDYRDGVH